MTAIELAAVASAAVPGLSPTACAPEPDDAADFDSAMLLDADRKRWRVRSPKHSEASTRLETELLVLRAFSPAIRAELPFLLPTVAGTVRQGDLTTFVYSHLAGQPETVEELAAGGQVMAREVGAAMAAIHDLPPELVNNADLPSYTANEFRQRKLNELDQAATTGKIPASLLRRWEHALEDVALWRFSPSVVHGDLHEDNILVQGGRVLAITGWTDLRIGDPADDFAWLVAVNDHHFVEAVQEAYSVGRKDSPDRHLLRRAALSAEFALAQWLVKGVGSNNAQMIAEAEDMLRTLERDILTYGGQPISIEETPEAAPSAPTAPAARQPAATGSTATGSNPAAASHGGSAAVTVEAIAAITKSSDASAPKSETSMDAEQESDGSADDDAESSGAHATGAASDANGAHATGTNVSGPDAPGTNAPPSAADSTAKRIGGLVDVQAVPLTSSRPAAPPSA